MTTFSPGQVVVADATTCYDQTHSTSMSGWDKASEFTMKVKSINPVNGDLTVNFTTLAGDAPYRSRTKPFYQLNGGSNINIIGSPTGSRGTHTPYSWSQDCIIPASTTKITLGCLLEWWLPYKFSDTSKASWNQPSNIADVTPGHEVWLYGTANNSSMSYINYGPGIVGTYTTSVSATKLKGMTMVTGGFGLPMHELFNVDQSTYNDPVLGLRNVWEFIYHTDCADSTTTEPEGNSGHYFRAAKPWHYEGSYTDIFGKSGRNCWAQVEGWFKNFSSAVITCDINLDGYTPPDPPEIEKLKIYDITTTKTRMDEAPSINDYNDACTPWWEEVTGQTYSVTGCTFTPATGGSAGGISITNGTKYTNFGTYTLTVKTTLTLTGATDTCSVIFKIKDTTPPAKPKIVDAVDPTNIKYDMTPRWYLGPCHPKVSPMETGVEYDATLTYTPFTNNIGTLASSPAYSNQYYLLGSILKDSGYYQLKVTATKQTNGLTETRNVIFYIDNMPPDPPTITVDGVGYKGVYGEIAKLTTPIPHNVTVQPGCTCETHVYFKLRRADPWVEITPLVVYNDKGYYKIHAVATKTRNGLKSNPSEVVFQKKIKYDWLITIDPNTKCYRTVATIHFDNDYSLKKMYKINNGAWKWYLGPVFIYENCTIYAKSLDGDDDYESNITSKVIDVIDSSAPTTPTVNITEGDVGSIFVPQIVS